MSKLLSIVKKLKQYEVPITSVNEEERVIHCDNFVLLVEEDGSLDVAFHVSMPPDEAAIVCLMLKEIPGFSTGNKIKVGESYILNKDGTCLFGEEAEDKFDKIKKSVIVNNYLKEQKQMEYLMDDRYCFHA